MKNRFLAIFAVVLILASNPVLASCGKDEPGTTSVTTSPNQVTTTSAPASATTASAEDKTSIIINKPGQENTVTLDGKVKAIIPANTLTEGTKVEINQIGQSMEHDFNGFKPAGLFEITSSAGSQLGGEITLEFSYDQSSLNKDLEISDQIAIAFYDEEYGAWQEVDFEVSKSNSIVTVKTSHLSLWSIFGLEDDYVTSTLPGFTIYFNKEINAPAIGSVSSGEPIYEYAAIVRTGLYDASKAYSGLNLKMPDHTRVYIDQWDSDKEAEWGWFSKNIEIPVTYIDEQELHMVSAHELFHAVQNQYVTFATMAANRWFMEATADYAAAHVATSYGLKDPLPYSYLRTGISSSSTFHMYQTAHFIKFLVDNGYSFKDLFEGVMNGSGNALANLNTYISSKGGSLPELYNRFAYDVLFTSSVKTEALKTDLYTDVATVTNEMDIDAGGTISQMINTAQSYTSSLFAVKLNSQKDEASPVNISAIEPTSGIMVQYVITSDTEKYSVTASGTLTHDPLEIMVEDGNYLYFIVTNSAPSNGYVTIVIGKEAQSEPYTNTRTAKIYNDDFLVDVDFTLNCGQPFVITRELVHGDLLKLDIEFEDKGKPIVLDGEAIVTNLRFADPDSWSDHHEPVFKETYWSYGGEQLNSSTVTVTINPETEWMVSFTYALVMDIHNTEDDIYSWGGGSTVIYVTAVVVN
ncbi:MAG: hypothetical protein PHY25_01610 [Dehalococcoidales bacterium]|nr:hypothetical protein [Dehalococcoidales bacterium]MDD4465366.1 hypothetical protein [Dehalococcoidales bacterium]MDD5402042.1 hypothetical protein [Dehalococcoidales bacterium]